MYLKRKVDKWLLNWKNKKSKKPALITGIRQCGKTESIREFAHANYAHVCEINSWSSPAFRDAFSGDLTVDAIIKNLSLLLPRGSLVPGETLLFLDEIQDCPRARLALKSFAQDPRFDVIASGSFLGISGYMIGDATPIPVGYEDIYEMKTMDFEEYLWASGISEEQIAYMESFFSSRSAVPLFVHNTFRSLYRDYICIGGFPAAVKEYFSSHSFTEALRVTRGIATELKSDFGRRVDKNGVPFFKPREVAAIGEAFSLIPAFLSKENKRFVLSSMEQSATQQGKKDAIAYLEQAHIISKVHNLEAPLIPLRSFAVPSQYKLFPADIGIANAMYGIQALRELHEGNFGASAGAYYEAAVFDSLTKAGFDVFYFSKPSGLKVDFVIQYKGIATLVEAKARTGNAKASKTVLAHPEHYGRTKLIKIGDYNIGENDDTLTIPHYMVFLLGREAEKPF